MASDNQTKYCLEVDENAVNAMKTGGCMSFVKSYTAGKSMNIVIPTARLSSDLTIEDVDRWIKIGNSLIFPSSTKQIKVVEETQGHLLSKVAQDVSVKIRPLTKERPKYKMTDTYNCQSGTIYNFSISNIADDYYITLNITESYKSGSNYNGYKWSVFSSDYIVEKTGQPLNEYLTEVIKDILLNLKPKDTKKELCVILDRKNYVSGHHFLAGLSFYRLLWSNLYKGIVKDTLILIDKGIDPWLALSYVWAVAKKDPYYGFSLRGFYFNDMYLVLKELGAGRTINMSFSNDKMHVNTVTYDVVKAYLNTKVELHPVLICTDAEGLKTLTKGKEYQSHKPMYDGCYLILCDDGRTRNIKHSRFTLK